MTLVAESATEASAPDSFSENSTSACHDGSSGAALYDGHFRAAIENLKSEGRYRVFRSVKRSVGSFPRALLEHRGSVHPVVVWCSNDYLGMGHHPVVVAEAAAELKASGVGAGGTRNISGTHPGIIALERAIAKAIGKACALVFTSGYVANETALQVLGRMLPGVVILSDEKNHASMIEGMRLARCERVIFRHNDAAHLEEILRQFPRERPKIIAFESVYSMEGDFAPIHSICDLARKYQAFTYLDETHAVGLYGLKGGGVAQEIQATQRIDVIQGGLGKGYGTIGGFVAASQLIIDTIRSFGPGFIFTTALPPHCAAAATHSVRWLSHSSEERALHREVVASTKEALRKRQIPFHDGGTHIIPIQVGDSRLCQAMADYLLFERGIYIQPINYPTVPRGTERLRVTPTPFHTPEMIEALCEALAAARGEAVASRMVA